MATPSSPEAWSPPHQFAEYRLVRPIGTGSMGQVFLAVDTMLERQVAVKFIAHIKPNADMRERFLIEARAAARLQHPNVVSVYRVGELDDRPYIVSEFIDGQSLDKLPLPVAWDKVLQIARGLARGLAAAHRRGVLHRDIKPANVIVTADGEVKVVDFGIAKLLGELTTGDLEPVSAATAGVKDTAPIQRRLGTEVLPRRRGIDLHERATIEEPLVATKPRSARVAGGNNATAAPLTRFGAVMGTPLYMSPEIWRGDPATPGSDVYSVGAMLYELASGRPPHVGDGTVDDLARLAIEHDAPSLADLVPGIKPEVAQVIDRCLCRDPKLRYRTADELLEALEELTTTRRSSRVPEGNPYRGLHAFEVEHRSVYFGRGADVRAVLERMRYESIIVIAGDSGVGKSSLCRAGIIPEAQEGALKHRRSWTVATMVPGRHPLTALAAILAPRASEEDLAQRITRGESSAIASQLRKYQQDTAGLLLFIDQLEELVTLSDKSEAEQFAETVVQLSTAAPGVRVLATLRGDFLTRVAALPGLGDEIARALYLLRPLAREGMREAIVGPARTKNVRFENEALVDALVEASARAEGGLPLLQFALAELWDARDPTTQVISAASLDQIGGVEGALARHADTVLESMLPPQYREARRILSVLVTPELTRARKSERDLVGGSAEAKLALEALVRARLIVARDAEEAGGAGIYELAHEALIRGWSTLRAWLEFDADRRLDRERLERAAAEWERLSRVKDALWGELQLVEVAGLDRGELRPREIAFLDASHRAIRRRARRRLVFALAVPLALMIAYGGVGAWTRHTLSKKVDVELAEARAMAAIARAKSEELAGLEREAFAKFDAFASEEGERIWTVAKKRAAEVEEHYERARLSYDRALAFDPGRSDVRAELGEAYFQIAALSERLHRRTDRDVSRIELYDQSGELMKRWDLPAKVRFHLEPAPATITVARYVEEDDGKTSLHEIGAGQSELSLAAGSYLFTLSAPGHESVRYPLLLARGESLDVRIALPARVPPGFIYIPKGRFLFGAADEEMRLGFYRTAPIHAVETNAYLIARHETTYADWLDFLAALPTGERAARTPKASSGGLAPGIELIELENGRWRLTLQPTITAYKAETGEPIIYPRDRHATQDWLQFPVAGISAEDAEAYVAWLDRTQKLPGARLCTEHEWERAARGADARVYPHGDRLDPRDANFDETYGKRPETMGPDAVGTHPASRSPFGLDDMAGNVLEWTRSSLAEDEVVVRSGSYFYGVRESRSVNREPVVPTLRDLSVGMRVCATITANDGTARPTGR